MTSHLTKLFSSFDEAKIVLYELQNKLWREGRRREPMPVEAKPFLSAKVIVEFSTINFQEKRAFQRRREPTAVEIDLKLNGDDE